MRRPAAALALGLAFGSGAHAQPTAERPGASAPALSQVQPGVRSEPPYLKGHEPDSVAILPPPPKEGSALEAADVDVYVSTRKLAGTPRWALATLDARDYFHGFGCVLGVTLSPATAPRLFHLLLRARGDASAVTNTAKDVYKRHRPPYGNDLPICTEPERANLLKSGSYPSGHTTAGWAFGLILSELAPDRADAILTRARGFGESRVVCGVHFVSDVQEGRTNGAALFAALMADPQFRADLEAARVELAALRQTPNPPASPDQCRAETDLAAKTPW